MISCVIHLKPVIEDICSTRSLVAQYKTRHLKLKRDEWEILEQLSPLLSVCVIFFVHVSESHLYSITGFP